MKDFKLFTYIADKLCEKYNPSIWGDCNEMNATAAYCLYCLGYDVKCVTGFVQLDNPLDAMSDDEDPNGVFDPRHFWIIHQGQILDFAAQQMEGYLDDFKANPYFFGMHHSYIEKDFVSLQNEFIDHELVVSLIDNLILE